MYQRGRCILRGTHQDEGTRPDVHPQRIQRHSLEIFAARPNACFVRGNDNAGVELLAQHMSDRAKHWGTSLGVFRCYSGISGTSLNAAFRPPIAWQPQEIICSQRDIAGTACLRAHPSGIQEEQGFHHHIEKKNDVQGELPKSIHYPEQDYDHRHVARLPCATIGVCRIHSSLSHGSMEKDFQESILPLTTEYQCDANWRRQPICEQLQHIQQIPSGLSYSIVQTVVFFWTMQSSFFNRRSCLAGEGQETNKHSDNRNATRCRLGRTKLKVDNLNRRLSSFLRESNSLPGLPYRNRTDPGD